MSTNTVMPLLKKSILLCATSLLLALINACSSHGPNELSKITATQQGAVIQERPEMANSCRGFYVSEQTLKDFYANASETQSEKAINNSEKLPCYAAGSTYIGDEPYQWILRSGGIGTFYNADKKITKICGAYCCNKVKGVC